jgi:hypothetical protein
MKRTAGLAKPIIEEDCNVMYLASFFKSWSTARFRDSLLGTKSRPCGVSTETSTELTSHTPRNSMGKNKSGGPPPRASQALSAASGSLLAEECRGWIKVVEVIAAAVVRTESARLRRLKVDAESQRSLPEVLVR